MLPWQCSSGARSCQGRGGNPPGHQHCHCRRMEEHYRCFLYQLVKVPYTYSGPKILKRTWQNMVHAAPLPTKAWIPGRPGNWFTHRRPSEASQRICSPRALSQNQLFRRFVDRQNTTAVFFSKYYLCSCKALGKGGLQFTHIVIYQLCMKLVLLKVTDILFLGVERISQSHLSDLSFLWPGFYYPENLFQGTQMNYKASFFKMLILPMSCRKHSHRLLWSNKGENKDLIHKILHYQTDFLLLM